MRIREDTYGSPHIIVRFAEVLILEKNNAAAKKLLITGTGQCNLTNAIEIKHFLYRYGPNKKFIRPALFHFQVYQYLNH